MPLVADDALNASQTGEHCRLHRRLHIESHGPEAGEIKKKLVGFKNVSAFKVLFDSN